MLIDRVDPFVSGFMLGNPHEILEEIVPEISQYELMQDINNQFQDLNIRKLMHNPKYNYRTSWIVLGNMQLKADDDDKEFNLDRTIDGLNEYLNVNKYPKAIYESQRDINKLIKDTIINLQVDGMTKREDVKAELITAGITEDRFTAYINQMKREGSLFELKEGYLKCI